MIKLKPNRTTPLRPRKQRFCSPRAEVGALLAAFLALPMNVHASMFRGEALDKVADVMTWVVLIVAPLVGIAVFLLVHILPEKIAEKKQHPQAGAIQCLCLLSLVFGGLLWPLAWLWAYTKPVLYKAAYGTDNVTHSQDDTVHPPPEKSEAEELRRLSRRVAELETALTGKSAIEGGKP